MNKKLVRFKNAFVEGLSAIALKMTDEQLLEAYSLSNSRLDLDDSKLYLEERNGIFAIRAQYSGHVKFQCPTNRLDITDISVEKRKYLSVLNQMKKSEMIKNKVSKHKVIDIEVLSDVCCEILLSDNRTLTYGLIDDDYVIIKG